MNDDETGMNESLENIQMNLIGILFLRYFTVLRQNPYNGFQKSGISGTIGHLKLFIHDWKN